MRWSTVASYLPGRAGKQCRERWFNHLCPEVKKGSWTPEEDRIIMESVARYGTRWSKIVKLMPGRTDNAIKNRYNSAMRREKRLQKLTGTEGESTVLYSAGVIPGGAPGAQPQPVMPVKMPLLPKTAVEPQVPKPVKRKRDVVAAAAGGAMAVANAHLAMAAPSSADPLAEGSELPAVVAVATVAAPDAYAGAPSAEPPVANKGPVLAKASPKPSS